MDQGFDHSDAEPEDEPTGEHVVASTELTVDVDERTYERIARYAEQQGMSIGDALERMLADGVATTFAERTPLQIAMTNLETLSREVYERTRQCDAAVCVLKNLVSYVQRVGGYMPTDDQRTLAEAKALLAQHGVLA
jgi:hypothetical protein